MRFLIRIWTRRERDSGPRSIPTWRGYDSKQLVGPEREIHLPSILWHVSIMSGSLLQSISRLAADWKQARVGGASGRRRCHALQALVGLEGLSPFSLDQQSKCLIVIVLVRPLRPRFPGSSTLSVPRANALPSLLAIVLAPSSPRPALISISAYWSTLN